ncbi:uncharacterized protein E0L32_003479 [Thyridium curvatum]|uniref:ATP-grasp domain-containing protein n=1 Tax=Thyridium curvatum TaxID=1093900 RepID=A0A507BAL9_9PEZI|nr:uncharacterized protein E0L32_003479 [Thyridium curvatum]TPX16917.1 hypothetical protein E0L32_003479 [Thyridium curvatum]
MGTNTDNYSPCKLSSVRAIRHEMVSNANLRDDILELRMRHCIAIQSVIRLAPPKSLLEVEPKDTEPTLTSLLSLSPGALLVAESGDASPFETLEELNKELDTRLSFDWVLPTQPTPRTVAMVGGRRLYDMNRGQYGARGLFEAAHALGMAVIVLDAPGHWLESKTYAHLRHDFIAIDVAAGDAKLPMIIAEAIKEQKVDGIVTFSDEFVISTAKAAELLGLPTEPVDAILRAHHKDETRKVVNNPNIQSVRLDSLAQLDDPVILGSLANLEYPLIAKPCRAGASRGVRKCHEISTLRQAIKDMDDDGLTKYGVQIETYVDGPEIDANFVLWNGELLFCEISDDFPCPADAVDATLEANFAETLMVHPTSLNPTEAKLIQSTLHQNLLKLGFRSGVLHVEARMRNSSKFYRELDGIEDLAAVEGPKGQPEVVLIEVNARPPGFDPVWATLHTYGVDLCALQFLQALGDRERYRAMSKPFAGPPHQFWCGDRQIPMHRDSIYMPPDFFERVFGMLPEVKPYVLAAEFKVEPGSTVSPRAGSGFVAYFLLCSRTSRRHLLEMCDSVFRASLKVLDGA